MYSVIDIESNGAPFRKESIIEIAVYRFDGHEITDQFISLVNPEDEISAFVQKLTGISSKMGFDSSEIPRDRKACRGNHAGFYFGWS